MAIRPVFNLTDKASLVPAVAGAALTAELCSMAFPESAHKRNSLHFTVAGNGVTSGATATELFIDGVNAFRFRVADQSTCFMKIWGAYTSSVGSSDTAFEITLACTNRNGTVTILANSTNVKFPNAGAPTLVPSVSGQNIILTATGVAGDANGRWDARMEIVEVTDLGA